jgi:transposase
MNEQRFVVSDVLWQRLKSYLPGKLSDAGATAKDNRLFLEAALWRVRTGSQWRDLPAAFGHWPLEQPVPAVLQVGQVRCIRGSFQSDE